MAIKHKIRHSDEVVKFWAEIYTELGITLTEMERELEISHSTLWWCFVHRLKYIDEQLYERTMDMIQFHVHQKKRRGESIV